MAVLKIDLTVVVKWVIDFTAIAKSMWKMAIYPYINGLVQDCSISIANALEI